MASNTETNFPDKILAPWTNCNSLEFSMLGGHMFGLFFLSIYSSIIDNKGFPIFE